jgi:hypothetical protein
MEAPTLAVGAFQFGDRSQNAERLASVLQCIAPTRPPWQASRDLLRPRSGETALNFLIALRRTLALLATLFLSTSAHAQIFRAYLAPTGIDSNPCTIAAPCRLLPAALNAVSDGGEIWMLDSANYNTATVNITKSVSILAVPGAVGSILAIGGPAVNIATAGVKIGLRNLVITELPGAGGTNGVTMTSGARLTISDSLFTKLSGGSGVSVSTAATVRVTDTTIRDTANDGILLLNGAKGSVTRSMLSGNSAGIYLDNAAAGSTTSVDISDSTIDGNANYGVAAFCSDATAMTKVSISNTRISGHNTFGAVSQANFGIVTLLLHNNAIVNNANGVGAYYAGARVWVSGNTVSGHSGYGLYNVSATFESAGNNAVRNNTTNTSGAITNVATM